MVGHEERSRLMAQYGGDPAHRAAIAMKCAVCLGVVGLIAVIGSYDEPVERASGRMMTRESPSVQHARLVYQNRAAHRAGSQVATDAARAVVAEAVATAPAPGRTISHRHGWR